MKLPKKRPFQVYCADCRHTWAAFYTPIILALVIRFKNICCPMCASRKVFCGKAPKVKR